MQVIVRRPVLQASANPPFEARVSEHGIRKPASEQEISEQLLGFLIELFSPSNTHVSPQMMFVSLAGGQAAGSRLITCEEYELERELVQQEAPDACRSLSAVLRRG